jgi:preprotein translocase subunit SecE
MAVEQRVRDNKKASEKSASKINKMFKEIKAEFNRITWPTKKEIKKALAAVVFITAAYMLFVSVADFSFNSAINWLFAVKKG